MIFAHDKAAKDQLVNHLKITGCPPDDATQGVERTFDIIEELVELMMKRCDAAPTHNQQLICLQLVPQILAGRLTNAMQNVRTSALAGGVPTTDLKVWFDTHG